MNSFQMLLSISSCAATPRRAQLLRRQNLASWSGQVSTYQPQYQPISPGINPINPGIKHTSVWSFISPGINASAPVSAPVSSTRQCGRFTLIARPATTRRGRLMVVST